MVAKDPRFCRFLVLGERENKGPPTSESSFQSNGYRIEDSCLDLIAFDKLYFSCFLSFFQAYLYCISFSLIQFIHINYVRTTSCIYLQKCFLFWVLMILEGSVLWFCRRRGRNNSPGALALPRERLPGNRRLPGSGNRPGSQNPPGGNGKGGNSTCVGNFLVFEFFELLGLCESLYSENSWNCF